MFSVLFSSVLCLALLLVSMWASRLGYVLLRELKTPYECGFDSKQVGRVPFSIRFFFYILLFIIFDVELVFFFCSPLLSLFSGKVFFGLGGFVLVVYCTFLFEEGDMAWEV